MFLAVLSIWVDTVYHWFFFENIFTLLLIFWPSSSCNWNTNFQQVQYRDTSLLPDREIWLKTIVDVAVRHGTSLVEKPSCKNFALSLLFQSFIFSNSQQSRFSVMEPLLRNTFYLQSEMSFLSKICQVPQPLLRWKTLKRRSTRSFWILF